MGDSATTQLVGWGHTAQSQIRVWNMALLGEARFLSWTDLEMATFPEEKNLCAQRMNIFLGLSLSEWLIIALLKKILALSTEQATGNQWFLFRDWCQWCWLSSLSVTTNLLVSQECWNHSSPFYSWFLSSVTPGMMNLVSLFLVLLRSAQILLNTYFSQYFGSVGIMVIT